ncbi:serine/arginine repetitive matrix protein 1 isoform X1 [Trichogramma pretiosum]|uniref:serine/arginine repetitive matrix protein 1 isoform X1 n=1 Tax=Trichogramma pretiosum TaxID=7493 RepID=UPI0006C989A6|nr:serine/arginine repetitive matrix protein 1 isoform X1 [Trichogramma pretiosum]
MIDTSHQNMLVMATGTENAGATAAGPSKDESHAQRLQYLQQRRDALQEKLTQKNSELKKLCIEEAELTGVLPPEIPLEPGESPPTFSKRVGTNNINHSQKLINKLKTAGGPEESKLELQKQIQIDIAESALAALNDPTETKVARRKHRLQYQQSQKKLQEINAQLNFVRQSHGGISKYGHSSHSSHSSLHVQPMAKHRSKKPRPPLESSDSSPKIESHSFLQNPGVSLSPVSGSECQSPNFTSYELQDLQQSYLPGLSTSNRATYHAPSPVEEQRLNNQNNNSGYRTRSLSQARFYPERPYRHMPNTFTEEERQMHYRQLKMRREAEEVMRTQQKYQDSDGNNRRSAQLSYYESDFSTRSYERHTVHDYPLPYNQGHKSKPVLHTRDSVDNSTPPLTSSSMDSKSKTAAEMPDGYWMRLNGELVWCSSDVSEMRKRQSPVSNSSALTADNRFGSLDRRKQALSHHQHSPAGDSQSRYHTVAIGPKNPVATHSRPYPIPQPKVPTPDNNPKTTIPSASRMLLRTQSLGSVENWQSPPNGVSNTEDDRATPTTPSSPAPKLKEKEWYETSLDSSSPPPPPSRAPAPAVLRRHNPPLKERAPVRSNSIPANRRPKELILDEAPELPPQRPLPPVPVSRYSTEFRVKEIPAESKPSPGSQENNSTNNVETTMLSLNSPTTPGTIVQPGKYQPYREVTKPFEMSDFYKYSTKFRKQTASTIPSSAEQQQQSQSPQPPKDQPRNHPSSIQRNSTCPSYVLR